MKRALLTPSLLLLFSLSLPFCITTESALKDRVTTLWQAGRYKKAMKVTDRFIRRQAGSVVARELKMKMSLRFEERKEAVKEYADFRKVTGRHSSTLLRLLCFGFDEVSLSGEDMKLLVPCLSSDREAEELLKMLEKAPSPDSIYFVLKFSGRRFFPSLLPLFDYVARNMDLRFKRAALISAGEIPGDEGVEIVRMFMDEEGGLAEILPFALSGRGDERALGLLEEIAARMEGLPAILSILLLPHERTSFISPEEGASPEKLLARRMRGVISSMNTGKDEMEGEGGKTPSKGGGEREEKGPDEQTRRGEDEGPGEEGGEGSLSGVEGDLLLEDDDSLPPPFRILRDVISLEMKLYESPRNTGLFDSLPLNEKREALLIILASGLKSSSIYFERLARRENFIERGLPYELLPLRCPTYGKGLLRKGLSDRNENIRKLSAVALAGCGDKSDIPYLREVLYSREVPLKIALIEEVGFLRDPVFTPLLEKGMRDESPYVRECTVESFGSFCSDLALPYLERGLQDEDLDVSKKSALALYLYSLRKEREEEEKKKAKMKEEAQKKGGEGEARPGRKRDNPP